MENLIKITPDKEKAKSILKMVETTLDMTATINKSKFPSNLTKEYYEIIRELISIVLLLDGYKTMGDSAHKTTIEYLESKYKEFNGSEISLINELRITRNKIAYDGFFVKESYIDRKISDIHEIISKLKRLINQKQEGDLTC
jgi:hypothetical protein